MSRQLIQIGLLSLLLIFLPHATGAAVVDQLIVVINGEPYTLSNVSTYGKSKMSRNFPSGDLNKINQPDQEVLEGFITEKLLEAESREAGINITEDEINRYIEQVKKNNQLSDDDLKTALGREGQTLASYKVSVKAEMEKSEIIDRQVRRRVNITDEDVSAITSSIRRIIAPMNAPAFAISSCLCRKTRPRSRSKVSWRRPRRSISGSAPARTSPV